jgi:hypothetical protein
MSRRNAKPHSKWVVLTVLVFLHAPIFAGVVAALVIPFIPDESDKSGGLLKTVIFLFGLFGLFVFRGIAGASWKWWKSLEEETNVDRDQ